MINKLNRNQKSDKNPKILKDCGKTVISTGLSLLLLGCGINDFNEVSQSYFSQSENVEYPETSTLADTLTGKNIIFIKTDQLAAASLNCYGSGVNSTPTLDYLSREGVRFDRAYSIYPACSPSRATILTSRSMQVHGVKGNNIPLKDQALTYAGALGDFGYHTAAFGKFHQRDMALDTPADPRFLGFDEGIIHEDTKWGPWLDWVRNNAGEEQYNLALGGTWNHGHRIISQKILEQAKTSKLRHYFPLKSGSFWNQVFEQPLKWENHDSVFITDKALEYIDRKSKNNTSQPFIITVSYVDPHDPYDPPAPYSTMFNSKDMPDPIENTWEKEGIEYLKSNQQWLNFKSIADDKEAIKKLRAHYHGSIKLLDDQIKRIVDYIQINNMWDNTMIVFTSDHGDMIGDHGLIAKYLPHYDKSIRIPLIVAGGGVKPAVVDELVSIMDFFPSFLDIAGIPPDKYTSLEGKSFAGYLYGEDVNNKWESLFIDSRTVQSIITKDEIRYTKAKNTGEEQLFDMKNDPDEKINIVNKEEYRDLKEELEKEIYRALYRHNEFGPLILKDYFGEYPVNVFVNGCRIAFDSMPLLHEDVPYLPVEKILKSLGADYSKTGELVNAKKSNKILEFRLGDNSFTVDKKTMSAEGEFKILNGTVQAAVGFFIKYLNEIGYFAEYDSENRELIIKGMVF